MTNKELLRAIIAEIDLIMHDKDYRFPESENTWYSRESCRVLTPEEVFEELRTELLQLNNETNREIAELQKQLADKKQEYKVLRILFNIVNNPKKDAMLKQIQGLQKKLDIKCQQITKLQNQLKSQPAEIVEKINGEIYTRMVVECKETKYTDINLILHNILKEYQK